MAKHKGDMLEALRATLRNAREEAAQAAALSATSDSSASPGEPAEDPGAGPAPAPAAGEGLQEPPAAPTRGGDELAELDRQLAETRARRPGLGLLVLQVVALATAFGLGRLSVSRPVAAEGGARGAAREAPASSSAEPQLEEEAPAAAPAPAADGTTADDRAFFDPQNRYTVQAITYADNPDNLEQAWAVYDEFRRRGLPAIQPRRHRSSLVLFVGAAARFDELADVVAKVRESVGPGGRGRPFESALVVSIEPFR